MKMRVASGGREETELKAALGRPADAQRCFERSLYLEPGHRGSLEHLALLLEASGDVQRARRLRARANRKAGRP